MRESIPLRHRPIDIVIIVFFVINFFFITYIVDFEQIAMPDPYSENYPIWPPKPFVDLVHWYGETHDPLLMARPPWWMATIWIDSLLFGPFYGFAIYAFVKGREWIRQPAFIWAGLMTANVTIILFEEIWGPHATPHLPLVLALNAPWLLFPSFVVARLWKEHPFTKRLPTSSPMLARASAIRALQEELKVKEGK